MKKLTIEGEALKSEFESRYKDNGCTCFQCAPCMHCLHPGHPECLANGPMLWNSVSTIKAGSFWFASYDQKKTDETVLIGKGSTEQEAIDNLPAEKLL